MNDAVREIKEIGAKIIRVVGNDFATSVFTQMDIDDVVQSTSMMISDMENAIEGNEVNIQEDEAKWVSDILGMLLRNCMLKSITEEIKDMLLSYALLAKNWNQLATSQRLDDAVTALVNHINYHQTVCDTIEVLKKFMDSAKLVMQHTPPAWEISKHYLLTLKDKLEGKKDAE